jgi:hypothetical protein
MGGLPSAPATTLHIIITMTAATHAPTNHRELQNLRDPFHFRRAVTEETMA